MPSVFPGAIDSFADPLSTSPLNSPSHAGQHQDLNDAVEKLEQYTGLVKVIPTGATNGTVGATGTVTVGNGVTSVTVSGAFSALYDNYRIIYTGGTQSGSGSSWLQLGSSNTNYNMSLIYNVGATPTGATNANSTWFSWVGGGTAGQQHHTSCELFGPFLTQYTKMRNGSYQDGTQVGNCNGEHTLANSYTSFTIGGLTFTGGFIRVYGYRN